MIAVEELLGELTREGTNEQGLPPGFRFHPTDEELITFYLASKVLNWGFCGVEIAEVDLNRCEPWELPDVAKMGEREWYFFSLRDRKYPTGLRTNRATGAGYWKATGKDRQVSSASSGALIGMKKTLVFYRGRAPRGEKTKWVMHEYRLDGDFSYRHKCKEEWVICRIFHKNGEKKKGIVQGQCYRLEASSSPMSGSLPPLLEAPMTALECQSSKTNDAAEGLQTSFLVEHRENYLNSHLSQLIFQPQIPAMNDFQPSMLFKSLLSYGEYCTLKEPFTSPKQCKSEANLSRFQLEDANLGWLDKIYTHPYPNPLHFEMSSNIMGLPETAVAEASVHEMSSSQLPSTGPAFRQY